MENILQDLLVFLPVFLISVTLHEFGHAFMAHKLGDPTPEAAGRLTLNPLAHLDVVGTLMMVFAHFGWAKPVPINPLNFTRKISMGVSMALVGAAGPLMNLFLAYLAFQLSVFFPGEGVGTFLRITVWVNAMLFVFNLIPIPPLDGSRILRIFLPAGLVSKYDALENYGFVILVIIIMLPFFGNILRIGILGVIELLKFVVIGA